MCSDEGIILIIIIIIIVNNIWYNSVKLTEYNILISKVRDTGEIVTLMCGI